MKNGDKIKGALRRWITGELRASGEKGLDRRAEEDPFLRDALEGLRRFPEVDHGQHLERMRQQLPGRTVRRRLIPLFWQRIAAVGLLLLGVGSLWLLNRPETSRDLSMEKIETPRPPAASDAQELSPPETAASGENLAEEKPAEPPPPPPEEQTAKRSTPPSPPPTSPEPQEDEMVAEQLVGADQRAGEPALESATPLPRSRAEAVVSGRVTDQGGLPVAGAEVVESRSRQSVLTDAEGGFALPLAPDSGQVELEVKHFNYDNTFRSATVPGSLNIEMAARQNQALRPPADTQSTLQPYPQGGFPALLAYLETSEETEKASRRQPSNYAIQYLPTATLAFTVYRDGSIGRIQVVGQTEASAERVQALIERLRRGPAWMLPIPGDSLRTQITLPVK